MHARLAAAASSCIYICDVSIRRPRPGAAGSRRRARSAARRRGACASASRAHRRRIARARAPTDIHTPHAHRTNSAHTRCLRARAFVRWCAPILARPGAAQPAAHCCTCLPTDTNATHGPRAESSARRGTRASSVGVAGGAHHERPPPKRYAARRVMEGEAEHGIRVSRSCLGTGSGPPLSRRPA